MQINEWKQVNVLFLDKLILHVSKIFFNKEMEFLNFLTDLVLVSYLHLGPSHFLSIVLNIFKFSADFISFGNPYLRS